jgi:hypothetical protein
VPVLNGYAQGHQPQYMIAPQATTGAAPADVDLSAGVTTAIDGTPVRVVMLALAGAAGLFAFRLAGVRFHVGVTT